MQVTVDGRRYDLLPGESVLDAMTRHGVSIPAACRAGFCQACLVRSVAGDPGPGAGRGLRPTRRAAGYFLACLARPATDLTLTLGGDQAATAAQLVSAVPIGAGVLRVLVRPERPVEHQPGQHVPVAREGGIARIYSIVSLPAESARTGIEFHVRVYHGGAMSGWLASAPAGSPLTLGAPAGECFYLPGETAGPLLLAGTGTGIAPLLGIARAALAHRHRGPVVLIHGAPAADGLYLGTRCPPALARQVARRARRERLASRPPLSWRTCLRCDGDDIADVVTAELAGLACDPGSVRAYLCGGERSVARMRRALFLSGMSLADIYADRFVRAGS